LITVFNKAEVMFHKWYRFLAVPEPNGKTIGLFRILIAVFGGLVLSYLSMCVLAAFNTPLKGDFAVVGLLYNTFAWAMAALWIALSPSKLSALLRFTLPTSVATAFLGWTYV